MFVAWKKVASMFDKDRMSLTSRFWKSSLKTKVFQSIDKSTYENRLLAFFWPV